METQHTKTLPRLLRIPGFVRFGIRIDSAAAWAWLALLTVALWPTWWWMGQCLATGGDDAWCALALAALVATLWRHRARLRAAPRLGLQVSALAGAVLSTALYGHASEGLLALIGVLSLAAGAIAFLPRQVAIVPVLGLSALSLPLLSALQTYIGYSPSDAAYSGLQMVWFGMFTACAVALMSARSNRAFIARLPLVGAVLLLGNILRSTLPVALQASGIRASHGLQTAVSLLVWTTVCGGTAMVMRFPSQQATPVAQPIV